MQLFGRRKSILFLPLPKGVLYEKEIDYRVFIADLRHRVRRGTDVLYR